LPSQALELLALAFELGLVSADLLVLLLAAHLLALHLVPDQSSGPRAQGAAYESPGCRMANGAADDVSRGGPSERPNPGCFLSGCEWPAGASRRHQGQDKQQGRAF